MKIRNERKCKICKETIKASNLGRHEKVCKIPKGKYKRKEGWCRECNNYWRCIRGHIRKGCEGKPKKREIFEKCKFCKDYISKRNIKRHMDTCKETKINRRRNSKYKKKEEKEKICEEI